MNKKLSIILISVLLCVSVFAAGVTAFDNRRPANDGVSYFDTIYAIGFQGDITVDTLLLDRLTIVDSGGTDSIDIYDDDSYAYIITDNSLVINSTFTLTTTGKASCTSIVLSDSVDALLGVIDTVLADSIDADIGVIDLVVADTMTVDSIDADIGVIDLVVSDTITVDSIDADIGVIDLVVSDTITVDSLDCVIAVLDGAAIGGGTTVADLFFGSDTWGEDKTADTVLITGVAASSKVFITWTAAPDSATAVYATTTAGTLFVSTPIAENGGTYNYLILK